MDLSAFLFSLGLLLAGIWLVFAISGDFKEKKRQAQRIALPGNRNPLTAAAARQTAHGQGRIAPSAARTPPPPVNMLAEAAPAGTEKAAAVDQFQGLTVSSIRETFERFTREL
jgi:hypothetical protein